MARYSIRPWQAIYLNEFLKIISIRKCDNINGREKKNNKKITHSQTVVSIDF